MGTTSFAFHEGKRKAARRPVSRVLSAPACHHARVGRPFLWDAPCGTPHATNPGDRAEMPLRHRPMVSHAPAAGRPYSVLLPVGFALPPPSPGARCAFTAPFHPCLLRMPLCRRFGTGGLFSVALSLGSPPPAVSRHRTSVEPGLSSNAPDVTRAHQRPSSRLANGGMRVRSRQVNAGGDQPGR